MDATPTDPPPEPAPGSPPAPARSDWTPASRDVLVRLAARKAARLHFLHALYEATEGLAERSDMAGGIAITHAGIKEVEAALSAPVEPTPRFPPARNVIRIEHAVNTVIQQGTVGSTQIARRDSAAAAEAAALADAVEQALEHLEAAETERADLRGQIEALRAQLAAPRPRLAALREAAVGIRAVIEAITRSGRAVGEGLTLMQRAGQVLARLDR